MPMSTKHDLVEATGDLLAEKIRDSILGIETLRAENCRLVEQVEALEAVNVQRESEVRWLNLSLEQERAERRHYHSLANGIITRLDVVGQTIDGVVKRAEEEVYRQRSRDNPRAETPTIPVPSF